MINSIFEQFFDDDKLTVDFDLNNQNNSQSLSGNIFLLFQPLRIYNFVIKLLIQFILPVKKIKKCQT